MSTIFVAVQCFQCSTMQVKQQKKSSNKWTCVICNEKQSVRKMFAQGPMARDVRKFVQSFNMSRQFADQNCRDETLVRLPEENSTQPLSNYVKKRTDWSEYVDPEDTHKDKIKNEGEEVFEPMIVTELPKAVFKKPKLNSYFGGSGAEDGGEGLRPVFSKRNSNKPMTSQDNKEPRKRTVDRGIKLSNYMAQDEEEISEDKESRNHLPTMAKVASKWGKYATQEEVDDLAEFSQSHSTTSRATSKWKDYTIQDKNENPADKVPWRRQPSTMPSTMKGVSMVNRISKWESYMPEDDEDLQLKTRGELQFDDRALNATLYGERVEEDIHPDFQ